MAGYFNEYGDYVENSDTPTTGNNPSAYNADGSTIPYQTDNNNYSPPAGAVGKNAEGNWVDKLGNVLAGVAGTALSPYLDNLGTAGYLKKNVDMLSNASSGLHNMSVPDLISMIPTLEKQVQQGTMSPAQYQAALAQIQGKMEAAQANTATMADSNMAGVQSNQESLLGARKALGQLDDIASNRGMTEADRAAFSAFMNQSNANAAQQRAAQLQQLQMQGVGGGGADLAARLSGVQGTSNANAAAGATMAQAAQARALQAIQAGLTGNTTLNAQQFAQDQARATAQDQVNQFNAAAKNAINATNAQLAQQGNLANFNTANQIALANQTAANTAGQSNAANTQQANLANFNTANTIAGKNTEIANQNLLMPYTATQANYTNTLDKNKAAGAVDVAAGNAMTNILNPMITRSNNAGAAASAGAGTTGSGNSTTNDLNNVAKAVDIGKSIYGLFSSDSQNKTDKEELGDDDIDNMMAGLTGYKYRYKGDKNNPTQAGIMAQDAEKGMPNSVVDTPAGKMIQKPEMLSNVLAVLSNQHNRIKQLEGK